LTARFGRGVIFSLVGAVFNSGSTLLVNIIVANLVGRNSFGEFAIVQNTMLTLSTVASLGTGFTVTKYVAEFRSIDKAKTGSVLGLCSVLSFALGSFFTIALLTGAPWIAVAAFENPLLTTGILLSAPVVFFSVSNFYQTGVLVGLESYPAIAKVGIISGTAYFVICTVGAYLGGRDCALAGLTISAAVQWLALMFFVKRECAAHGLATDYRGLSKEINIFLKFSLPSALSGLSYMPILWLANCFLVRQPGGYTQMAYYAAATNLRVVVLFLPQLMNNVGMSLLNNAMGLGDYARCRKVFWGNLALIFASSLVGAVALGMFGPFVLSLFGKNFDEGYSVLLMLLASTMVETLMQGTYQIIQSQGRMWLSLFAIALPRDLTILLTSLALIPDHGALGLAIAYVVGWSMALISNLFIARAISHRSWARQ
jgi:O-antigen/teichoic acid export membrane protein